MTALILSKIRAIFAAFLLAGIAGATQAATGDDYTDLGVWGPFVGLAVALGVGYLTPERLDRLEEYIRGRKGV